MTAFNLTLGSGADNYFLDQKRCENEIFHQALRRPDVVCGSAAEFESNLMAALSIDSQSASTIFSSTDTRPTYRIGLLQRHVDTIGEVADTVSSQVFNADSKSAYQINTLFALYSALQRASLWLKDVRQLNDTSFDAQETAQLLKLRQNAGRKIDFLDIVLDRTSDLLFTREAIHVLNFTALQLRSANYNFLGSFVRKALERLPVAFFDQALSTPRSFNPLTLVTLIEGVKIADSDPISIYLARFIAGHVSIFDSSSPDTLPYRTARDKTLAELVSTCKGSKARAVYSYSDPVLIPAYSLLTLDPDAGLTFIQTLATDNVAVDLSFRSLTPFPAAVLWCWGAELASNPYLVAVLGQLLFNQLRLVNIRLQQQTSTQEAFPRGLTFPLGDTLETRVSNNNHEACLREFLLLLGGYPQLTEYWYKILSHSSPAADSVNALIANMLRVGKVTLPAAASFLAHTANWDNIWKAFSVIQQNDQLSANVPDLIRVFWGSSTELLFFVRTFNWLPDQHRAAKQLGHVLRSNSYDQILKIARNWTREARPAG